jgi:thiamine thiazole synthase
VVQDDAKSILDDIGITNPSFCDEYYTADAVEAVTTLASRAVQAGARVFNCISIEDVMLRGERVIGWSSNWSPVEMAGLHVDPLTIRCMWVIEATGHTGGSDEGHRAQSGRPLLTESGAFMGEKSMWADRAESSTPDNTREAFPGVWVCGMSANATFGSYRMGPIFGGNVPVRKKVAGEIDTLLRADAS